MKAWKNADFPIRTEAEFEWQGEKRPGFRTLWLPDGSLCEPTTMVFGYKLEKKLCLVSTMEKELYAIREFFVFMANNNIPWYGANDKTLRRWRETQLEEIEAISNHQIERKISWVFDFYRLLPDAWPLDENGKLRQLFVGKPKPRAGVTFPITTKTVTLDDGKVTTVWSGLEITKGATPDPSLLDEKQVGKVLSALRLPGNHALLAADRDQPALLAAERNWAIGKFKGAAGLRDIEVERATLKHITEMLCSDHLLDDLPARYRDITSIAELSADREAQEVIYESLNALQRNKRRGYLFLYVKGKGNKERKAYFLIDEVKHLLTYIWETRPKIVALLLALNPSSKIPDNVILSLSRRKRIVSSETHILNAGSIGDLLADAFERANVAGSGHDLRKYYATLITVRIFSETMAIFNFQVTDTVMTTILSRVREALGHKDVDTTIEFYVNLARLHYFSIHTQLKRDLLSKIWGILLDRQHAMSDWKVTTIHGLIDSFARQPDDASALIASVWDILMDRHLTMSRSKVTIVHRLIDSISQQPDDSPVLVALEKMFENPRMWPPKPDPEPPSPPSTRMRVVK